MEISELIKYIDKYLEKHNIQSIDAVNANALLAKAKLLRDSEDRPGKPLRDLLRKGSLPHAYQSGGEGTKWIIPHSKRRNLSPINGPSESAGLIQKQVPKDVKNQAAKADAVVKRIVNKIEEARLKYKPSDIKCLLIAEAPPDSIHRFFYFENVKQHDYLFLGIAEALYPELKAKYLLSKRNPEIKTYILNEFAADGFYLLDLSDLPLSLLKNSLKEQLPGLIQRIKDVAHKQTNIVLIKVNVYDIAYNYLIREGYKNIANIRIPFPGQGVQHKFQIEFKKALTELGEEVG